MGEINLEGTNFVFFPQLNKVFKFTFLICTPIPEGIPGLVLPRLVAQAALRRNYAFKI